VDWRFQRKSFCAGEEAALLNALLTERKAAMLRWKHSVVDRCPS
jgi:hypothetical protein